MHFKNVLSRFPLSSKVQLFWERITFSRVTTFYFAFSLLHCIIQLVFQVQAFLINAHAAKFLLTVIEQGNAFDPGFAVVSPDDLRFCDTVPDNFSTAECQVIWSQNTARNGTIQDNATTTYSYALASLTSTSSLSTSSTASTVTQVSTSAIEPTSTKAKVVVTTVLVEAVTHTTTVTKASPTTTTSEGLEDDKEDADADAKDTRTQQHANKRSSIIAMSGGWQESVETSSALTVNEVTFVNLTGSTTVTLNGQGWKNQQLNLSERCLFTLNWPVETLDNTKREDVTFIVFQVWVLGMSIVALLNESMPHIIASLLTHVLATAWGGFQIFNTTQFHQSFVKITTDGACGHNLLPSYWQARATAEIASVSLNGVALLLSIFLSWRLIKLFGWQTFKRVGASRTINRVYMLVLSLSIAIQLSFFFIVVSIALWIDQLYNGSIGRMATKAPVYKGTLITVLILLFPWLTMGWISVRRELRIPMLIFLAMSVGYLAGWGGMFASSTFRWTFFNWRFFSVIVCASLFLTLITFIVGLVCRINFGKGLPKYLNAQEPLPDETTPSYPGGDSEKVDFPTARGGVPTFSAAFGRGDEVPPPSQMVFGPPKLGPRFNNLDAEPFEPQPGDEDARSISSFGSTYDKVSIRKEPLIFVDAGNYNSTQLSRTMSTGSHNSTKSYETTGSFDSMKSRRWVIE